MIAMSRGIGPLGLPVMPAGTPAAAPAPGGAAPGAFDAAFADLTSALLATVAGAGQPAAAAKDTAAVETPAEPGDAVDESTAAGAIAMAVAVPLPAPVAFVPVATGEGAAGDMVAETADAGTTAGVGGANTAPVGAAVRATPPSIGDATGFAAISDEITGGLTRELEGRGDTSDEGDPVAMPIDPIVTETMRRQVAPTPAEPVAGAGEAAPAAPAASTAHAHPGGHGSSTGVPSAHTHANGQSPIDGAAPAPAAEVPATPLTTEATASATPAETPAAPVVHGLARRAEALQRALGRRAEAEHGETAPAGLVAQTARAEGAVAPATETTNGQGANDAGEASTRERRAIRIAAAAAGTTPAVAAGATERPTAREHVTETAATPNWRAAALAARFADPVATGEGARPAASTTAAAFAASVVAAEMPALREFRPATVETVAHLPQEPVTAEHVHMQIVKSMRLQWTGSTQEARVALKPEYLGEVVANIKVEQGVVTATLHADTPEVRRMLESQTASLRDALVEHGLKLDKLVIAEPETPSGQPGDRRSRGRQPQPPSSRPKRRARQDGNGATFELSTE